MFSGKTRFCYGNRLLQAENLPLPNFFKICASCMDTRWSPVTPPYAPPHVFLDLKGFQERKWKQQSLLSPRLEPNSVTFPLFSWTKQSQASSDSRRCKSQRGVGNWGHFCISFYYSCPEPRVGCPAPGSPGEKANETSCPQRGKDKQGESTELVFELPGSQGKSGYLMKHTAPTSRKRAFPPGTEFSQRTFVLSANIDALSG